MSIKKWHQLAEEELAADQQTQEIRQKFRMDKINKEFGQLSREELFKPITKRLDEKSSATVEEEEKKKKKKRSRKVLITQLMNLTKSTRLIMNSDLMLQHHHYHQYHHQVHQQYHQKNNHNYHQNYH